MKQVVQNVRSGRLTVEEVPPSALSGPGVLVATRASVVSAGTEKMIVDFAKKSLLQKAKSRPDLVKQVLDKVKRDGLKETIQTVFTRLDQPMALGYSSAGTVLAVDSSVTHVSVGDRIACAGAGYALHANVVYVPRNLTVKIPDNVSFEQAAFGTLGAIAMQGVRVADLRLGENVAIIGLGLLGLIAVQLVKAAGCRVVGCDLDPAKLDLARQLGADVVCQPTDMVSATTQISAGHGVDSTIITAATSSNQPIELAGEITRMKGTVSIVGAVKIDIPRKIYYEKELAVSVSRSYGPGRYDTEYEEKGIDYPYSYVRWTEQRNIECFLNLLADGKVNVDALITHHFSIDDAEQAYRMITGEIREPYVGIVLTYPQEEQHERVIHVTSKAVKPLGRKTVGLAVVGAGNFATATMLPRLVKLHDANLVAVTDQKPLAAKHAAQKFQFNYVADDLDQILSDDNVDAVLIATRHDSHAEQAIRCLKAGKHVALEKPMCLKDEEVPAIVDAVNNAGRNFIVGFNRRFAPVAVEAKAHFPSGVKTLSYVVNAGFIPPEHWVHDVDIGGGRIIGEVCHFIDWIQWFTGAYPVEVTAVCVGGEHPDMPNRDNTAVTLKLSDGSVGTILYVASGDKSFRKEHIEVFGGGAVAVIDEFRNGQVIASGKRRGLAGSTSKGHFEQWQAFVDSIVKGEPSPIPFIECVISTLATFAAVDSLNTGAPVVLPQVITEP